MFFAVLICIFYLEKQKKSKEKEGKERRKKERKGRRKGERERQESQFLKLDLTSLYR
jgi:hypothetical protein